MATLFCWLWGSVLLLGCLVARAHAQSEPPPRNEAETAAPNDLEPASSEAHGADEQASMAESGAHAAQEESPPRVRQQRAALVVEAFEPTPAESLPASPERASTEPREKRLWDVMKVLPIVFYTPETSLGLGAGALFLFDMPGATAKRRPSSVALGAIYTLKDQIISQATPQLRFGDDDLVLTLDVLGQRFPNRFYGLGNDTKRSVFARYTDRTVRGDFDARVRPFARSHALGPVYVGAHYRAYWTHMRDPKDPHGLFDAVDDPGEHEQLASGVGPVLAWDTRDGLNWPLGGSFVELKTTFNDPHLGGTLRYQTVTVDARRYQPLWLHHILALRLVSHSAWGEVPFQQLPTLGGTNLLRGWYGGQLRDRQLAALEAEYRVPIRERWAVVAFGSIGQVARRVKDYSLANLRAAGGAGLRFAIDKESRTNIRLDLAYGDHFYPYVQFREAF